MPKVEGYTGERPPVHDKIEILSSRTIFRTGKWWKVATHQESFGGEEWCIYLFLRKDDEWVRKQKLSVKGRDQWEEIAKAMEALLS